MLKTEARCCQGKYLYLPTDVRTETELADFLNCRVSILATPGIGATFIDYLVTAKENDRNIFLPCKNQEMERFIYLLDGEAELLVAETKMELTKDGYVYIPPGIEMNLCRKGSKSLIFYYMIRRYRENGNGEMPELIWGNRSQIRQEHVNGEHSQKTGKLLPEKAVFDLSANILSFAPGVGFKQIESHVQEHGIYVLEGEACFYLDQEWISVEKGDYLWLGPYVPHCCYGTGTSEFSYLLVKDDHRNYQEFL